MNKFGDAIEILNFRNPNCANIFSIFCYRRFIEIILIIFAINYPWIQASVMTFKCILVVIIFGHSLPFHLPRDRRIEYFNEVSILICSYHLFLFTDFVDDADTRYQIGYSMIAFTSLNILVNLLLLVFTTMGQIVKTLKQVRQKYRITNLTKKLEERNKFSK